MALTPVAISDSDAPIPYMLPIAAPARLAVTTAAALGFTFTNGRATQPAGDQTPIYVTIVGDAAWTWCQLDQSAGVPVAANQPLTFPVGTTPVTIYCRAVTGATNLSAFAAAKANPPSTF